MRRSRAAGMSGFMIFLIARIQARLPNRFASDL